MNVINALGWFIQFVVSPSSEWKTDSDYYYFFSSEDNVDENF